MTKSFEIPKALVWKAFQRVKANGGSAGVDRESIEAFERSSATTCTSFGIGWAPAAIFRRRSKPYRSRRRAEARGYWACRRSRIESHKQWSSRSSSHCSSQYSTATHSAIVRGGLPWTRSEWCGGEAGITTGLSSSTSKACSTTLTTSCFCERSENIAARHGSCLYIERWLKAPMETRGWTQVARERGTPQGGVVSPLLANLFLHYALDTWMRREMRSVRFCRYADDGVIHCKSEAQAQLVLRKLEERLRECGLELHPEKTRIVYCQDINRTAQYPTVQFTFLGYTFRPRKAVDKYGRVYVNFSPAVSRDAMKAMRQTVRGWHLQLKCDKELSDLSNMFGPVLRGWANYYGRFYRVGDEATVAARQRLPGAMAAAKVQAPCSRGHPRIAGAWTTCRERSDGRSCIGRRGYVPAAR